MAKLTGEEVGRLAAQVGFSGEALVNIIAITKRESDWNPDAYNGDRGTGDNSVGLSQINMIDSLGEARTQQLRELGYNVSTVEEAKQLLKDPVVNLRFAYYLSSQGTDFSPWGAYKGMDNLYATNVEEARAIASSIEPTSPFNARKLTAPTQTSVAPAQQAPTPTTPTSSWNPLGKAIKNAKSKALEPKTSSMTPLAPAPPPSYDPTGDFQTDASYYWSRAQDSWEELDRLQQMASSPLIIDTDQGIVIKVTGDLDNIDPNTEQIVNTAQGSAVIDIRATKILQQALASEQSLDRLYSARQAGLMETGQDAAAAYLNSEKEKSAEATRRYEDYVRRVSDLVAIEDIPQQRMATLASTISAINKANASRSKLDSGMLASGGPQFTDTSPFANAIKSTIPAEAPQPYNVPTQAMEPLPAGKYIAPTPEEVLQKWGSKEYRSDPNSTSSTFRRLW